MPYLIIIMIIISGLIIVLLELPKMIKEKKKKEIVVFSFLLLAGLTHALMQGLGMEVSSNIEVVFKVIGYIRESLGWIIQGFQQGTCLNIFHML